MNFHQASPCLKNLVLLGNVLNVVKSSSPSSQRVGNAVLQNRATPRRSNLPLISGPARMAFRALSAFRCPDFVHRPDADGSDQLPASGATGISVTSGAGPNHRSDGGEARQRDRGCSLARPGSRFHSQGLSSVSDLSHEGFLTCWLILTRCGFNPEQET